MRLRPRSMFSHDEVLNLGLGNVLYLSYLRTLSVLFLIVGLLSVPNIVANSQGGRYTLATLPPFDYAATHSSIANLGSASWTPGSDARACSGRGFAALTCARGGWGDPLADYQCGSGNASTTTSSGAGQLQFLLGTVIDCPKQQQRTHCACFPGYHGERCESGNGTLVVTYGDSTGSSAPSSSWAPAAYNATVLPGFCSPTFDWRDAGNARSTDVVTNAAPRASVLDPRSCSGHGQCVVRYVEASLATGAAPELAYTFCACQPGFWGADCAQLSSATTAGSGGAAQPRYQYGDYYNRLGSGCQAGVTPVVSRWYISDLIGISLPRVECGKHGVAVRLPTAPDGLMTDGSSAYRAQTPGLCACEPGFAGEQCMGGQPVPDQQGYFTAAGTLVLLAGLMLLYRQRKVMQQAYDDSTVSPGDFTVFVDGLPPLDVIRDAGDVRAHFERFGPVHSVACACDDEVLVALQAKRERLVLELQIVRELQEAARCGGKAGGAAGALPVRLPPLTDEELAAAVRDAAPVTHWQLTRLLLPLGRSRLLHVDRALLLGALQHVDRQLAEERVKPRVRTFERAFVTFLRSADADRCLDFYSTAATNGIFGARPTHSDELLFRGRTALTVAAAAEPDEVQWDALDEGASEILKRRSLSYALLLVLLLVLYVAVQGLDGSKGSWPAEGLARQALDFAGTLAIAVLNEGVGSIYKASSFYEQHYNKGSAVRSVYLKTLLTQLFTSALAATLGVFSFPLDLKNGYIQDWFATAGPFIFRLSLIESVLPPLLSFTNLWWRLRVWLTARSPSATAREKSQRPPEFMLAEASAALLRTVIMCAAFNAGLPVLNFVVAGGLGIRYFADKWLLTHMHRLQRTGPELSRSLELSLMCAILLNAVMCWGTMMAARSSSIVSFSAAVIVIVNIAWALTGYFSWKLFRGQDCWAGSGPLVPCSAWLCCFNERVLAPFQLVHRCYMKAVFGSDFFVAAVDEVDETAGRTYLECVELDPAVLRVHPYFLPQRVAACPELYGSVGAWASSSRADHLTGAKLKALRRLGAPSSPVAWDSSRACSSPGGELGRSSSSPGGELGRSSSSRGGELGRSSSSELLLAEQPSSARSALHDPGGGPASVGAFSGLLYSLHFPYGGDTMSEKALSMTERLLSS